MARLIPSFIDDVAPPGERQVFSLLASGPESWLALHALDIAPWNRGLRTEIDFVVVIPESGILCIEVKSQPHLTFDGSRWYPDTIRRSPFRQAQDGRHSFYRRLADLAPQLRRVPVVHCCIFTHAAFDLHPNLSVQPWELMDTRALSRLQDGAAFCADLKTRIDRSIAADANLSPLERSLSRYDLETIVRLCVPVQRRHPDSREEIRRREHELDRLLRDQQKPVLQLAAANERIVVSGGAGTGKTLIALEAARRAAEGGRRVALLCFNQLVGEWMKKKIEETSPPLPGLVVGRAIQVLTGMADIRIPETPPEGFWDHDLPRLLEERLTDPDFAMPAQFDHLVIDEAQDILARPWLWHCLTHFLSGDIGRGTFALFGDFDHQVLAQRELMRTTLESVYESGRVARWKLSENCRNYRIVGETALRLAGFRNDVYSGYLRPGGGIENYDIFFYEHDRQQLEKLTQLLRDLRSEGYKPSEITLLSFRADHLSAASRLQRTGHSLRPAWQGGSHTAFASVYAFKGMESKVVILTDLLLEERGLHRDLFYTGMTRATESVRVLCDMRSRETILSWLSGRGDA